MKIFSHSTQTGLQKETHRVNIKPDRRTAEAGNQNERLLRGRRGTDRTTKPIHSRSFKLQARTKVQVRQPERSHDGRSQASTISSRGAGGGGEAGEGGEEGHFQTSHSYHMIWWARLRGTRIKRRRHLSWRRRW